jgi:hypothetical protein
MGPRGARLALRSGPPRRVDGLRARQAVDPLAADRPAVVSEGPVVGPDPIAPAQTDVATTRQPIAMMTVEGAPDPLPGDGRPRAGAPGQHPAVIREAARAAAVNGLRRAVARVHPVLRVPVCPRVVPAGEIVPAVSGTVRAPRCGGGTSALVLRSGPPDGRSHGTVRRRLQRPAPSPRSGSTKVPSVLRRAHGGRLPVGAVRIRPRRSRFVPPPSSSSSVPDVRSGSRTGCPRLRRTTQRTATRTHGGSWRRSSRRSPTFRRGASCTDWCCTASVAGVMRRRTSRRSSS